MDDWSDRYAFLLGRRLQALIWMPIAGDTPKLVAEFKSPSFSYSGAAFLAFENAEPLILTWSQAGENVVLGDAKADAWTRYSLDRIHADRNDVWAVIEGGVLQSAELYTAPYVDQGRVLAVRHRLTGPSGVASQFWIGTGGPEGVEDRDDLWVGVDVDPPNFSELMLVSAVS